MAEAFIKTLKYEEVYRQEYLIVCLTPGDNPNHLFRMPFRVSGRRV